MSIGKIINHYGRIQSPYARGLVNHLPMAQVALYKMDGDLKKIKNYSQIYIKESKISPVKTKYEKFINFKEHLGFRERYESCLELINHRLEEEDIHDLIGELLNTYELGMSSGIFHTINRLAYAVGGYSIDNILCEEIARALAYYITAYREAKILKRPIKWNQIQEEMIKLSKDKEIEEILNQAETLGQGLKGLYNSQAYLEKGFVLEGSENEKIKGLLSLVIPTYYKSGNIVVLHSITGLHALIVLKDYFKDFNKALDILTSSIITHLLAVGSLDYQAEINPDTELSWDCLKAKASESTDVHALKLTYTAYELDKKYDIPGLKDIALKRIKNK